MWHTSSNDTNYLNHTWCSLIWVSVLSLDDCCTTQQYLFSFSRPFCKLTKFPSINVVHGLWLMFSSSNYSLYIWWAQECPVEEKCHGIIYFLGLPAPPPTPIFPGVAAHKIVILSLGRRLLRWSNALTMEVQSSCTNCATPPPPKEFTCTPFMLNTAANNCCCSCSHDIFLYKIVFFHSKKSLKFCLWFDVCQETTTPLMIFARKKLKKLMCAR